MSTTFQRGQFVRITYGEQTMDGMVMLASSNGRSLVLGFDGAFLSPSGGMHPGAMPVLMGDDGVYRDLIENHQVQVQLKGQAE